MASHSSYSDSETGMDFGAGEVLDPGSVAVFFLFYSHSLTECYLFPSMLCPFPGGLSMSQVFDGMLFDVV